MVPIRDASLEEELKRQQDNEALRIQFAEHANEVGAYIEARSAALAERSMHSNDTMEEQLEAVKAFQAETLGYQPILDQAEATNKVSICQAYFFLLVACAVRCTIFGVLFFYT